MKKYHNRELDGESTGCQTNFILEFIVQKNNDIVVYKVYLGNFKKLMAVIS